MGKGMTGKSEFQFMAVNRFQDTAATRKIFGLKRRIRAVAGGTSASKTISILIWCIDYAQNVKDELISVVSESFPHLEKGVMLDFETIMKAQNFWDDERWHQTKHTYTFGTGSKIEFFSVDTYGKAHGPRRDVLFVNEANNLEYNIVDQLITRTRKIVWMDWNPSQEFWFYTEMLHKRDDIDFITLTYLDNDALDETTKKEIESHMANKYWWQVYGLGQLGVARGRIYSDWQIVDGIPHEAKLERYGLDFGYTNDPTAIVGLYAYNGGFIVDELTYQKGLSNKQIADILDNSDPALVIADSSEPKSIDEISSYGISILPSDKGPGSVNKGIQLVQDQRISVTKRSLNIIREYRNYLWQKNKDDRIINVPSPGFDHALDALRYALNSLRFYTEKKDRRSELQREIDEFNRGRHKSIAAKI